MLWLRRDGWVLRTCKEYEHNKWAVEVQCLLGTTGNATKKIDLGQFNPVTWEFTCNVMTLPRQAQRNVSVGRTSANVIWDNVRQCFTISFLKIPFSFLWTYEITTLITRICKVQQNCVGRDSSVGIATVYGLDGLGIECRWAARFSVPVQTGSGAQPASYSMGAGSFPGVKQPGRGVDHLELYLYSPSGSSWPVLGWTLPLPLQWNSTYPNAGYPDRQLCGSVWPFGQICREFYTTNLPWNYRLSDQVQ